MYKLTYESEDDLDESKKSKNPIPQFERQVGSSETMQENKENRSESLDSVVASSYAAKDYEANQQTKLKKKFYELFRSQGNNMKSKECSASKCVTKYGMLAIVVALTCGVVALFVLYSGSSMKNKMLTERLSVVETAVLGGSFVLQAPPLPDMPEMFDIPQALDHTEYDQANSRLEELRERVENIKTSVLDRIQGLDMHVGELDERLTESERRVFREFKELKEKIKSANGMAALSLDVSSEDKEEMMKMDLKSVVFSASHATMPSGAGMNGGETFEIGTQSTLKYDIESIDNRNAFSSESGEFVAPVDGAYVFQFSFCGIQMFGNSPELGLMKNDDVLKRFNPSVVPEDGEFEVSQSEMELGLSLFSRNSFSSVSLLKSGDRVRVDVLSGSIFELHSETDSCTTFSGYHV